jgi:hypothetical protein
VYYYNNNFIIIIIITSRVAMIALFDAFDPNDCKAVTPSDVEDGSSTTSSGSYIDYGQLRVYSETREHSEVDEKKEEDSEVEDEEVDEALEVNKDPVACDLCGKAPYDWDLFGEEIWEECNSLKEGGLDNKAVIPCLQTVYSDASWNFTSF